MNYGLVIKILGRLLMLEALLMIPSLIISIIYQETDMKAFAISIALTGFVGLVMSATYQSGKKIHAKEGLAIVTWGWILVSVFGALPFYISQSIPSIVDALFETISGITTTGASILSNIEELPKGILFWRSFTHWIGGMGILVFTLALLPTLGVGGFQIYKAESPGPISDKIVPKLKDTASILYKTYIAITLIQIFLLLIGGMNLYDASIHTFGTLGTGGFSNKNASIAAYDSSYIHMVIAVFMMISATNFSLIFALYKGKIKEIVENAEFRFYVTVVFGATFLIAMNLWMTSIGKELDHSLLKTFRDSFFQVTSIISTTGYATVDFDQWTTFAKFILFILMFFGGCAGSTGGSMKIIRVLAMVKLIRREVAKIFHPRAMIPIKIGKKSLPSDTLASITSFVVLYFSLFVVGTLVISLDNDSDLITSTTAIAATLGNIGPGLEMVGPTRNFSHFSDFSKIFMSVLMLLGRLELFTMLALFAPKKWKNEV